MRDERDDRFVGAEGAAIVEERHGHEEVSEEHALHAHEREHAGERAGIIVGGEVDALVPEHALHDGAPSVEMKVCEAGRSARENIPLARCSGESFDARNHSTAVAALEPVAKDIGSLRHCATLRKRN